MMKKIIVPHYLKERIIPIKRGFPKNCKVFVGDVETANGKPYLLTLYDGKDITLIEVTPENIEIEFVKYLMDKCRSKNYSNIMFFHNLPFDLTAILNQNESMFEYQKPPIFETVWNGCTIGMTEVFAQNPWFANVTVNKGVRIKLVDSTSFIPGSLEQLSRKLNLEHKKPKRPEGVTEGKYVQTLEDPEFRNYVEQEILTQYDLAMYILDMHKKI